MQNPELQRRSRRRDLRVPLRVEIFGHQWSCADPYAINLSSDGMCLQVSRPPRAGERLSVRFRLGPQARTIWADAKVAWVTGEEERAPGMHFYEVGLRFLSLGQRELTEFALFAENIADYWLDEQEAVQPQPFEPDPRARSG